MAGARMGSADPVRAEVHRSGFAQRQTKRVKLALPEIVELDSVGLGETQRIARPSPIGMWPSPPDGHVVGLGRGVLVEFR